MAIVMDRKDTKEPEVTAELPTKEQLKDSELVVQAVAYWFADHGHVRSPFPTTVQEKVAKGAVEGLHAWLAGLKPDERAKLRDEDLLEKFESVLFDTAMGLVTDTDQLITLRFPFLPRCGDRIDGGAIAGREGENIVRTRRLAHEDKDEFLVVEAECVSTGERWETRFELP
jgi:hypothetical protein